MGGLFTRSEWLNFKTLSSGHLDTTHRPISYRIRFMACRSYLANKIFSHSRGGGGVRPLVEYSTNSFLFFETFPYWCMFLYVMLIIIWHGGDKLDPSVAINPEIRMGLSLETLLCCNIVEKNLFIKDTKSMYAEYDDLQKLDHFQRILKNYKKYEEGKSRFTFTNGLIL